MSRRASPDANSPEARSAEGRPAGMDALREQIRAQVRQALAGMRAGGGAAGASQASVAALMQRFEAGYVASDAEAVAACFAPDVVWILPDARVLNGRAACLAFLKERFASPVGPRFSDSRLDVLGQTVVQHYKVSVPTPGGKTAAYDGTDVYRIRDGLISRKDAYWKQLAAPGPASAPATSVAAGAAPGGVVVPLRVGTAAQAAALTGFFQRLAASPAMLKAAQAGLLRFDMRVDDGAASASAAPAAGAGQSPMAATNTADRSACCAACQAGNACACDATRGTTHDHGVPELQGVIGERQVKALPPATKTIRLHPKAVLTPLGKDALRRSGITVNRGATA